MHGVGWGDGLRSIEKEIPLPHAIPMPCAVMLWYGVAIERRSMIEACLVETGLCWNDTHYRNGVLFEVINSH